MCNLPTKFKRDHCLSHKIISYTVMDKTSQENDRTNSVITMGNLIICIQCHHFSSVLFVICTTDVSKLYLFKQEYKNFNTPWSGRLILATIIFLKTFINRGTNSWVDLAIMFCSLLHDLVDWSWPLLFFLKTFINRGTNSWVDLAIMFCSLLHDLVDWSWPLLFF